MFEPTLTKISAWWHGAGYKAKFFENRYQLDALKDGYSVNDALLITCSLQALSLRPLTTLYKLEKSSAAIIAHSIDSTRQLDSLYLNYFDLIEEFGKNAVEVDVEVKEFWPLKDNPLLTKEEKIDQSCVTDFSISHNMNEDLAGMLNQIADLS